MNEMIYRTFGLLGILIVIFGLILVFFYNFHYFYSIFLIGWLLLFEYIAYKVKIKPIISKNLLFFFSLLLIYVILHLTTEVYGRLIGNMWYYPNYYSILFYINLQITIYGLGTIACMETYRVSKEFFSKKIKGNFYNLDIDNKKLIYLRKIFFYLSIIFFFIPLVSFFFFNNWATNYLYLFPLLGVWLFFDSINRQNPLIKDLLEGKKSFLINFIFISLLIGFIHEFPNTYVWEWIYRNIPFTDIKIINIPIIVLLSWIPLITWNVAVFNFVESKYKIDNQK